MVNIIPASFGAPFADGYPNQNIPAQGGVNNQGPWDNYEWIVVCAGLAAFFMAWGIGANDVANAFATSVGSKTLKLWQACVIAAIFEFTGAMVLGGEVTKTIASDIARVEKFNNEPEVYMYGMLCALTAASIWLFIATYACLAVSTTHSIIGAIMGFALVFGGHDGVRWNDCKPEFPWSTGFLPVVLSWFVSPLCAGILSSIIFTLTRTLILRRKNSTNLAFWMLPVLLLLTFFINLFCVLSKGAKKDMEKRWPPETKYSTHCSKKDNGPGKPRGETYKDYTDLTNAAAWISVVVAAGVALIGGAVGIPLMKRRYARDLEEEKRIEASGGEKQVEPEWIAIENPEPEFERSTNIAVQAWFIVKYTGLKIKHQVLRGLHFDVHQNVSKDATVSSIHEAAEVFDPHTEQVFKYLQVFSACCVSFAHGSNDVANSIGPFAGIWAVYNTWQIPGSNAETPKWQFVLGGLGIVVGLMTYGYNIIMELGVTLLKLTPSRGFSAELATGLTISLASAYGLPVSTTQIIVGAETGVGLCESIKTGVNFPVLLKTFSGWVFTIIIAGLTCACIFSMGVYAPSVMMADDIQTYKFGIGNATNDLMRTLNTTNVALRNANLQPSNQQWWTSADVRTTGNYLNGSRLNSTITSVKTNMDIVTSRSKNRNRHFYTDPEFAVYWLRYMISVYKNQSVIIAGQNFTNVQGTSGNLWNPVPK